jgi:hypothetical protein
VVAELAANFRNTGRSTQSQTDNGAGEGKAAKTVNTGSNSVRAVCSYQLGKKRSWVTGWFVAIKGPNNICLARIGLGSGDR